MIDGQKNRFKRADHFIQGLLIGFVGLGFAVGFCIDALSSRPPPLSYDELVAAVLILACGGLSWMHFRVAFKRRDRS